MTLEGILESGEMFLGEKPIRPEISMFMLFMLHCPEPLKIDWIVIIHLIYYPAI